MEAGDLKAALGQALRTHTHGEWAMRVMEAGVGFVLASAGRAGCSPLSVAAAGAAWLAMDKPAFAMAGVLAGTLFAKSYVSLSSCLLLMGGALLLSLWYGARGKSTPALWKNAAPLLSQALPLPLIFTTSEQGFILGLIALLLCLPVSAAICRGYKAFGLFVKGKRFSACDPFSLILFAALFMGCIAVIEPALSLCALCAMLLSACALCRANRTAAKELDLTRLRLRLAAEVARELAAYAPAQGETAIGEHIIGIGAAMERISLPRRKRRRSLCAQTGAAALPMEGSSETGDAIAIRRMEDSLLLLLSDGMGSGPAAHRESASAVALYGDLLAVGFGEKDALKSVNSLLLLNGEEESYATLDAARIDLSTGEAIFLKQSAPPAFLLRGGQVSSIYAEAPPLGILNTAAPGIGKAKIKAGDCLILMTDGLSDALGAGLLSSIIDLVGGANTPQDAAEALIERGSFESGADDMSVVVARFMAK